MGKHLVAALIDKDDINEPFAPGDRESDFYKGHVRDQTYAAMDVIAMKNLRSGTSVVLDSPFNYLNDPSDKTGSKGKFKGMVEDVGANLKVVQCYAPDDVLRARLEERGDPRDRSKIENDEAWERYQQSIRRFETLEDLDVRKVDTTQDVYSQVAEVVGWLVS